ncbi:MAG: hypothetical protein A3F54_00590 [Candidatus Kerfeldbacteria bacterium RIFCSPHIGHO2_12_FULL_48_17]|uniref:Glycerophosphoryl diester phosphodiesterase membrane domain-containing protein n=1 Tax=Candidatus Kerfeldbacteria bacterium RIFCSPHIGHO2_12_FULL_48_17 TaxID=1798542 RepID=A0A1G2B5H7_9BACT|nr:MAG: hypothetical protein A3F54_00590 [Candidatus Kerfeldbacteria bacterium RIFCSPHIGHO2_12_FULL_48_17]
MATQKSPSLSLVSIVQGTWNIIAEKYLKLFIVSVAAAALSLLGFGIFTLVTKQQLENLVGNSGSTASLGLIVFLAIFVTLVALGIQIFSFTLIVQILSQKKETPWVQLIYNTMERFWPTVLLALVLILVITLLAVLTDLIAALLLTATAGVSESFFGGLASAFILVLSALPILLITLLLMFMPFEVILNKANIMDAFRTNVTLLRGHFFRTLGYAIMLYFAIFGLTLLLQLLPFIGSAINFLLSSVLLVSYVFVMYTKLKNQN